MIEVQDKSIVGVWFVVEQNTGSGVHYVIAEETKDKPRVGKRIGDYAASGLETRHAGDEDCIDLQTGQRKTNRLESLDDNLKRGLKEEFGLRNGYESQQVGIVNFDCAGGEIGQLLVAVYKVVLRPEIRIEELRPFDLDTKVIALVPKTELFNGHSHRAGSKEAVLLAQKALCSGKIIQAKRYES